MMSMELPFTSRVISGNRITIPKEIVEILDIKEGDKLIVTVKPVQPFKDKNNINETSKDVEPKSEPRKFCKICGAPLPTNFAGDYCPNVYSCGNHLHVLGQPHNAKLCAFCSFPGEVTTVVNKRKNGWAWEKIWNVLTESHTIDEANGIEQAAKLLLNETE